MSKSLVEKYEQMLSQDPTSTVFVELARAYLERGDNDRAIALCQQGCEHHPNSVVGRVLWGKGLIAAGRAAEAMKQFDLATGIDKENPHAYNLIGEVLLRRGLYRSALPVLRKAALLQPNDGRISQWLEQTKAALAGGPAPVLYDSTTVEAGAVAAPAEAQAPAPAPSAPVASVAAPAAAPAPAAPPSAPRTPAHGAGVGAPLGPPASAPRPVSPSAQAEATNVGIPALSSSPRPEAGQAQAAPPSSPRPPVPELSEAAPPPQDPDVFSAFFSPKPDTASDPTVVMPAYTPTAAPPTTEIPTAQSTTPSAPVVAGAPEPTGELPIIAGVRTSTGEVQTTPGAAVVAPMTAENPLQQTTEVPLDPFAALASRPGEADTVRGLTSTFDALQSSAPAGGGLLGEIASLENRIPTSEIPRAGPPVLTPVSVVPASVKPPLGGGGLLDEIPEVGSAPVEIPRSESSQSHQNTEAIAKAYERELREKLEANTRQKTFLQKYGLALAAAAVAVVVGGGLTASFLYTRHKNKGETLESALANGQRAVAADTKEQYETGLQALDQALKMDDGSTLAWATSAFAHAVLFAEHGGSAAERTAALDAIGKPNVRATHADLAAVVDFLTAEPAQQTAARQALLTATTDAALTQAGKLLLADKKPDDAFAKLSKAVELNPKNVRALVLLGDYYLGFEDYENALKVLGGLAEQRAPAHPQRVLGMSQARLELGRDLPTALAELESLPKNAAIPAALQGRYSLLLGRAQSANGKHEDAAKTLNDGLAAHPEQRFDFTMGLGNALRLAGSMDRAQKSFEDALKLEPKREDAKEALGRALLARSREKELLDRLKPEPDAKKVALVRGIAFSRLSDFKRARLELAKTQVGGKYPAEAAVYLAIADAAEEQGDKPIQLLEKLATQTKRHKATVQVALARVYMQLNQLDKARSQLEEAAKDPSDYEANTQLAELLLNAGLPFDVALEPLQRAIDRNASHAPARHLLARTFLSMGRPVDAQKQVDLWTQDNPASELAWRDMALVQFRTGHVREAEAALAKGLRADSDSVEGWRLKAQVLFARGDARGAFASLERANKLNPKDPDTFCEIGNAYVRQGNFDVAPKAYEAARRENPKSLCGGVGPFHAKPATRTDKPTPREELTRLMKNAVDAWDKGFALATLARVQLEFRDVKGAVASADEATAVAPGAATSWFAAGEVARRTKNEAKALEAYLKATQLDASWSTARLAYADALMRQGGDELPKALAEYQAVLGLSQNDGDLTRVKKVVTALKKQLR